MFCFKNVKFFIYRFPRRVMSQLLKFDYADKMNKSLCLPALSLEKGTGRNLFGPVPGITYLVNVTVTSLPSIKAVTASKSPSSSRSSLPVPTIVQVLVPAVIT